ncbi:hypothetical protein T10_13271 [Trichinella papuae]|uniref:Uncharacterized protein n=1 Tax=Trichinella papuae TaxID=268474 RepID=A0A0V1MY42_9BILA|nr:hypothetical protein T10_13271 [Trichinella papuae]
MAVAKIGSEFNMHSVQLLVSKYLIQQAEMTKLVATIEKMTDECRNFTNNIVNVVVSCEKFTSSLEQVLKEIERMQCLDERIDVESVCQSLIGLEEFRCQMEEVQKIMRECSGRCWIHTEQLLKSKANADDYFNSQLSKELSKAEKAEKRLEKLLTKRTEESDEDKQPPTDNLPAEKLVEKFRDKVNALKRPIKLKERFINNCLNETIGLIITNLQPIQNLAATDITISNRILDNQVLQDDYLDGRNAQNDGCAFAPRKQKSKLNWMKKIVKGLFKRMRSKTEEEEEESPEIYVESPELYVESPEIYVESQQVYVEDKATQTSFIFPSGRSLNNNEPEEPSQTEQNDEREREFRWRMYREQTEFYGDEHEIMQEKRYCFGMEEVLENESYVQRMYGNADVDSFDSFPNNLNDYDRLLMTEEQFEKFYKMIPCDENWLKKLSQNDHSHTEKTTDGDLTRSEDNFKMKPSSHRNETNSSTMENNSKFH